MAPGSFISCARTPTVREDFFALLFERGGSSGSWRAKHVDSRPAHLDVSWVAAQLRRQTRIRYRGFWSDIKNRIELLLHANGSGWLLGDDLAVLVEPVDWKRKVNGSKVLRSL